MQLSMSLVTDMADAEVKSYAPLARHDEAEDLREEMERQGYIFRSAEYAPPIISLALHFGAYDTFDSSMFEPGFLSDLRDCAEPGQEASGAVAYVMREYVVTGDAEAVRACLKGYGAWEDDELGDHETNLGRMVWLLGGNLREGEIFCVE